jgi:hypothetical protein
MAQLLKPLAQDRYDTLTASVFDPIESGLSGWPETTLLFRLMTCALYDVTTTCKLAAALLPTY